MKQIKQFILFTATTVSLTAVMALGLAGCSSDSGSGGNDPINCGEHGSAHDDHCHCETNYLFNGKTCVEANKITEKCDDHHDEHHDDHHDDDHANGDHHHEACVCPADGKCHCDGEIVTISNQKYCVPNPHKH